MRTAQKLSLLAVLQVALLGMAVGAIIDDEDFATPAVLKNPIEDINDINFHPPELLNGGKRGGIADLLERDMTSNKYPPIEEINPEFWRSLAREEILGRVKPRNIKKAKNVIMFLGDGMSLNTLTAARILKGQRLGKPGEEQKLSFEKFPFAGLSKTYCANAQVADSACTATAYLCGVKTNIVQLGVTAAVQYNNCTASMDPKNHVSSIAAWAQAAGKSTGFITTTTLTHASPSGSYAHAANRFWECDTDVRSYGAQPAKCMDIAQQLVTQSPGRNFEVMMGGGMGKFLPKTLMDIHGKAGERSDGMNLLARWQGLHPNGLVVTSRDQLLKLDVTRVTNIMGLFNSGLMDYHLEARPALKPTLTEMTQVALKKLALNPNGYFIFIEGGLIDYGNHQNKARIALDETLELEKAVQKARDMTSEDDTLIVVTSDHAHPLSIAGYPGRGSDILGLNPNDVDSKGVPYSTLNYAVGPKQYLDSNGNRVDLTGKNSAYNFEYPSYINAAMGNHGGDDVGVFASGPYESLFTGSMQQSSIPHMMAYAACIGNGPTMCNPNKK